MWALKFSIHLCFSLIILASVQDEAARKARGLYNYLKRIGGLGVRKLYRSSLAVAGYNKFRVSYRGHRRFYIPYWVKWVQYPARRGPSILSVRIPLFRSSQPRPRPRPRPRPQPRPRPRPRPLPRPYLRPRPLPRPQPFPPIGPRPVRPKAPRKFHLVVFSISLVISL